MKDRPFTYSRLDEQSVRVAFEGTTYVLRVKREGVHSAKPWEGALIRGPAWIFSRARWEARPDQNWVVETLELEQAGLHMQLGGHLLATEVFATQNEAVDRANALLVEWGATSASGD